MEMRPCGDIDLCVAPEQFAQAAGILTPIAMAAALRCGGNLLVLAFFHGLTLRRFLLGPTKLFLTLLWLGHASPSTG
jgi:hypothetical protein